MHALTVDDALAAIVRMARIQPPLQVPLADAFGQRLFVDVHTSIPLPPWTNASMDGYAVRQRDIAGATGAAPRTLTVVGTSLPGSPLDGSVAAGEAVRIFTGAAVPADCDSVVRQEDTDRGERVVSVLSDRDAGANIRVAGSDLAAGGVALRRGSMIGAGQIALLAGSGITHPTVFRAPRVGIIATGDELTDLSDTDRIINRTRLADVNTPALTALVRRHGGVPVPLGIARDECDCIRAMVREAADVDVVLTAGGASVGDHDHVRDAMQQEDAQFGFQRVRIRPGGPTAFAMLPDGRAWLALPGNPVSALVTFTVFGGTLLRAMTGVADPLPRFGSGKAATELPSDRVLELFLRCRVVGYADGMPLVELTGPQGSGMLTSIARADFLVRIPPGSQTDRGETVATLPLD